MAGRKPSERFMRKPIQARARASHSERTRLADLVSKLGKDKSDTANEASRFAGYRPGQDDATG